MATLTSRVKAGFSVLVLWQEAAEKDVLEFVSGLQSIVTETGNIQLEHILSLDRSTLKQSTFDVALYGFIGLSDSAPSASVLSHILTVLKQNGSILLKSVNEPVGQTLESLLKCAGFVTVQKADDNIWQASKPSYEVGSSVPLKRNKKVNSNVAQVWTLTNTLDDDIIDSDTLLTSEDWQKPDLTAAKADCGTGQGVAKKACKNCTCGLAEQLEQEVQSAAAAAPKSACGNCYLGDAFRCSGCPYRGMPAFKPGEVVSVPQALLQ